METVRQVIDDDPVPPSRLVPRVPRDLETICLKCLHKDPAKRYESAQALADDLERYLRGEPIQARRTPFWERGAKWARRRPRRRDGPGHRRPAAIVGGFCVVPQVQRQVRMRRSSARRPAHDVQPGRPGILDAEGRDGRRHDLTGAEATLTDLQGQDRGGADQAART